MIRTVAIILGMSLCGSVVAWGAKTPVQPYPDGQAPEGAVVLFDGGNLAGWRSDKGKACAWKVEHGEMRIVGGGGNAVSQYEFEAGHLHLEFNLPKNGKGHGNSGLYIHRLYELQIIDSFNKNPYKPGQQCGALYKEHVALKQVCKAPGQWQTYDIIFHGAKLSASGKVQSPARFTIWFNGVLIHNGAELATGTGGAKKRKLVSKGPLLLQNHGAPVKFRNIWIKPLAN